MSVLTLECVSKRYADTPAVHRVSLDFTPDTITAVIGPSGCGKSTLLKLCNGLVRPDDGTVRLFGQPLDYRRLPALRRRIGYAVQGNGLFPHLSARRNIALLAELEGWPEEKVERRLAELADLTRLGRAHLDRYPHELSGGQQQRVGLCRAMMLRPEVLLLDEPFAAIDPITRSDIQRQLQALHSAEPSTAVLVTHDMREALRLADHIVVMGDGSVLHSASTPALLAGQPDSEPEALLHALLRDGVT